MPGKVFKVNVSAGAQVKRGQTLVVLEAMKMEYSLKSPADCKVVSVRKAAGDLVALDEIILELEK